MPNPLLSFLLQYLARTMQRRAPAEKIRAYVRQKAFRRPDTAQPLDPRSITVAVVQERIALLPTYQAYADRMHAFVQQAVDRGAQLVCFPEENGALLLGQLPLIRPLLKLAAGKLTGGESAHAQLPETDTVRLDAPVGFPPPGDTSRLGVPYLLSFFSPFMQAAFEAVFSELARGFGVYIMAGSMMIVENQRLYNRAFLFDPQGRLVGAQDKAHPDELEIGLDLSCTAELKVFETPLGRLAFPVCMDATYFETFKILKQLGAQVVIIPIANLESYEYYFALRGIWPRVQESGVYGLKSALVGDLYGLRFTGKAGIYAPLELTEDRSGVIAEGSSFDQDEVITACLDLTRLNAYVSNYFSDTNPALYQRYFSEIYQQR